MTRGSCELCLEEKDLLKSHYIPKALYPTKRQKSATVTRRVVVSGRAPHLKAYLLCRDCETRFEQNGESEVLKWLAPKAKRFSLAERLKLALPRERFPDSSRFAAYDIGLDAAKFAYFALSVVWRGAVHGWSLPDGTRTKLLDLGPHQEAIRKFLAGETEFPHEVVSVVAIVCSDPEARSLWIIPCQDEEAGCQNYRFIARGVLFRVLLGPSIPPFFRDASCVSPRQPIAYGDCSRRVKQDLPGLLQAPVG
jgi:hypothetical protein